VLPRDGQLQPREQPIRIANRASGDQSDRAAEPARHGGQKREETGLDVHLVGSISMVQQRAVDVEEQRVRPRQRGRPASARGDAPLSAAGNLTRRPHAA
jgi:hypothetical protein